MRKGSKNTKIDANTKTRRCVVRVKRMKPQPSQANKRTVAARPTPVSLRRAPGPASSTAKLSQSLSKRAPGPASSTASAKLSQSLSKSFKAKDREQTPIISKNVKVIEQLKRTASPAVEELPPTLAAGRSRRAHKPNPKYANEDLLTPKSLKLSTFSSLDESSNKASNDSENESVRQSKAFKTSKYQIEIESDSDYEENNDDSDSSQYERVTRSRPAKTTAEPLARKSVVGVVNTSALNKTAPNAKSAPTQLQQLRRTLNASNVSPLAICKKRKLEEISPSTTTVLPTKRPNTAVSASTVATKKPTTAIFTPGGIVRKPTITASTPIGTLRKPTTAGSTTFSATKKPAITAAVSTPNLANKKPTTGTQKLSESDGIMKKQQSPTVSSNLTQDKKSASTLSLDKKSSPLALTRSTSVANLKSTTSSKTQQQQNALQRGIMNRNNLGKASSTSTPSLSKSNVGQSPNSTPPSITTNKTRSSLTKAASSKEGLDGYISSDVEETPTITIDDFETMPTFTIVNINDIINKKGDVLISEADEGKTKSAAPGTAKTESTRNVQKQQIPPQSQTSKPQMQSNKQQSQQSKQAVKKQSPEGAKTFSTSTPLVKKPVERAASNATNKIINRNSASTPKPSPQTLKSTSPAAAVTRPKTRSGSANVNEKKPAPRILNSVVSPRTKPIKPVINNLDVSDDDPSGSISLYTDEEEEEDDDEDEFDGSRFTNASILDSDSEITGNESEVIESPKKRLPTRGSPASSKNKVSTTTKAAKENSAAANNCLPKKQVPQAKQPQPAARKFSPEKVVVHREGNKIIKKITCFETWYVINVPADAPEVYERNSLDIPLIDLANSAKEIPLPSDMWTTKVTLLETRKSPKEPNVTIYTGDLTDQKIKESDRAKYQPSCVMFRRTVADRVKLQLPYDRAVIFKNKTFFTNIEGKNVKLVGAPTSIKETGEVETLLNIVDGLTLQSPFVEPASTML